ncbi:hypothetical protein JCM8097_001500 [Rhodosporidiobolus ruineniae]
MPLVRSDSSHSTWQLPADTASSQEPQIHDQRRLRHLHSILVRGLSLDPERDELTSALLDFPSTARLKDEGPTFANGAERDEREKGQGNAEGRKRVGSEVGARGPQEGATGSDERELVLDDGSSAVRTRPRRSSSGATLLTVRIAEESESEPPSPSSPVASTSAPSAVPFPPASSSARPRSTSRLSASSLRSSSTLREAPRLPPLPSTSKPARTAERPPHPSTAQFAQREKQRREELLRRRLLDSFVMLELVSPEEQQAQEAPRAVSPTFERKGRRRGNSVVSIPPPSRLRRSDSASSIATVGGAFGTGSFASPRKHLRRRGTSSSILPLAANSLFDPPPPAAAPAPPPSKPFFVSLPCFSSTHPSFSINRDAFLLSAPPSSSSSSSSTTAAPAPLDHAETVDAWPGLRESRVRVKVFVRPRRDEADEGTSVKGKGKEREKEEEDTEGWECLIEWDVELSGLTSLGRDPTAFPPLPPDTLLFALTPSSPPFSSSSSSSHPSASSTPTDLEYFTAPLPLLHRALRKEAKRRRRERTGSEALALALARERGALSEDDLSDYSDSSSLSSSDDASEGSPFAPRRRGAAGDADDDGNLSDPGVLPSSSRTAGGGRARSGTLTLAHRRAHRTSRRRRLLAAQLRQAEERRRRLEVVETSRRETRMVRAAEWERVREVWERERECWAVRGEVGAVKGRVEAGMREEGWDLEREKAELQDRVEDLAGVKLAVEDEVVEAQADLDARRAALDARRARLAAARLMDEEASEELDETEKELDDTDRTLAALAGSAQTRRTQLITLLSSIFPIEPVLPSASQPNPPPLLFSILSLPLPNSSFPPSCGLNDDHLSSALGYAAQLTALLAAYLGVPLVYPVRCRGSRSTVTDLVSMMKGPRAFPLYAKGVDEYRFDYGVFLLNKDIEQLLHSQSLTCLDLRNTLPNLKSLLLSLSYDPSHADYRAATLLPEPAFSGSGEAVEAEEVQGEEEGEGYEVDPPASPHLANGGDDNEPGEASSTRMSRSPSLASTIRAARSRSRSPTGTIRGEGAPAPAANGSGATEADADEDGEAEEARPNGHSGANGVEKPLPASSASSPSSPHKPLKTPHVLLKEQRALPSRSRSSSGSSTSTVGYGRRFADGLWSAVAGGRAGNGRTSVGAVGEGSEEGA